MRTLTTLITLAALSLAYNASLERWPRFAGVTAIQTAVGVAYTLLAATWLLDRRRPWRPLAVLLAVFAAAGAPMLAGDMRRDLSAHKLN